jgi:outer membrane protein assembly factor BamE
MRFILILFSLMFASCAAGLTPYKMDIRQGNLVTPDMREKLKIGMSKLQVRYVLGTPTINDPFHGNRWDYVYRLERGGQAAEKQDMTLYFEGDNLARIEEGGKTAGTAPAKTN